MSHSHASISFCPSRSFGTGCSLRRDVLKRSQSQVPSNSRTFKPERCSVHSRAVEGGLGPEPYDESDDDGASVFDSNPQFAAVFRQSMQRRGKDALTRGAKPISDERKPSPAEEVLHHGLRQARRNVLRLESLKKVVEASIEDEERQFERMQFALRRATADAAYIRTLQKLRSQDKAKFERLLDEGSSDFVDY